MATYAQLVELAQNAYSIRGKHLLTYGIDSFAEHLPREVSQANDEFYAMNKNVPGVMNYDGGGYTEPEDERDIYANNQALSRIPELIPYLDRMNKHLPAELLTSNDYSRRVLHLGAEVLAAKDYGLSKEEMDYIIDEAFPKDYQYFGCRHREYQTCDARWRFEKSESVEDVRKYQNIDSSLRQMIDFYLDDCRYVHKEPESERIDILANCYNADEAYGLYEAMKDRPNKPGFTINQCKGVHDAVGLIIAASEDKTKNHNVTIYYEDGDSRQIPRFSDNYSEGYVQCFKEIIHHNDNGIAGSGAWNNVPYADRKLYFDYFDKHPEKLSELAQAFVDADSDDRWLSDFYAKNFEKFAEIVPESDVKSAGVKHELPRRDKQSVREDALSDISNENDIQKGFGE